MLGLGNVTGNFRKGLCHRLMHFPVYQVWLEGEDRAELQAIARTAKHRLQRGIWTSPGAGQRFSIIL